MVACPGLAVACQARRARIRTEQRFLRTAAHEILEAHPPVAELRDASFTITPGILRDLCEIAWWLPSMVSNSRIDRLANVWAQ